MLPVLYCQYFTAATTTTRQAPPGLTLVVARSPMSRQPMTAAKRCTPTTSRLHAACVSHLITYSLRRGRSRRLRLEAAAKYLRLSSPYYLLGRFKYSHSATTHMHTLLLFSYSTVPSCTGQYLEYTLPLRLPLPVVDAQAAARLPLELYRNGAGHARHHPDDEGAAAVHVA